MSNSPKNHEQSTLLEQTENQRNPGAARPEEFKVEARDGGQHGDSVAERAALLAEADNDAKSSLREPMPTRNEVPHRRYYYNWVLAQVWCTHCPTLGDSGSRRARSSLTPARPYI
jgi:hypothetical protein